MKGQDIRDIVEEFLEDYPKVRDDDKKLVLLYWKFVDGVEMTKDSINTKDFITKATSPMLIINAKWMVQLQREDLK
jgi:hypothetical protein